MPITINMAFSRGNMRVDPLKDGTVKPEGIELNFVETTPGWIFHRNLYYDEFDATEMSISSTFLAFERRGDSGKWNWSAIPVFVSHGSRVWTERVYINTASGIDSLCDLKGKRIAVSDYEQTAALWMKIVMKDLCGIEAKDNVWYNGRTKELSRDKALGLDVNPPPEVERHWLQAGQYMDTMLDRGELDAAFIGSPYPAEGYTVTMERSGGIATEGNTRVRLLLPDRGKAIMAEYHTKFGHRQTPNHHVIIQNRILKEHPWVAMSMFNAFEKAKEVAYERAKYWRSAVLVFEGDDWKEHADIYGPDPYPIGLKATGKSIERAVQGSIEQGLLRRRLSLDEIYHPTTLDT